MLDALVFEHAVGVSVSHCACSRAAHPLVQLVYKGRLDDLWLLSSGSGAHGGRIVTIGRCITRVCVSLALRLGVRLRLERARAVAIGGRAVYGGRAHCRCGGGGRNVHGVSRRRQGRARRGQNGYRLVQVGIVGISGEGTSAGLCDRSHGADGNSGEQARC